MTDDKRKSPRIPLAVSVMVMHSSFGERILKARDISDGGMFIYSDGTDWPSTGTIMQVQALDTPVEATILDVRIVHVMPNGIGVMFCD